jgi:SAM-dependent methyltransferase
MTVKDHYNKHLGNFYSWYTGNFEMNNENFKSFCLENEIKPFGSGYAIDLGAGHGIQTIALAAIGYKVKAIDFNNQLIDELKSRIDNYPIEVFNDDIRLISKYSEPQPELIVCCGDTLPHLDSLSEIQKLIKDSSDILVSGGKIILTFRDYSTELDDKNRFIPIKSDSQRILTCFIEYFPDKLRVTDLLHEFENGKWVQKVSSYSKVRIDKNLIIKYLDDSGFKIDYGKITNGMVTIIANKN